jgi:hypothetical protein
VNKLDKDAFERAIAMMRSEADGRELLDAISARQKTFAETGETAAYYCQCRNLKLKSHQPPPMYAAANAVGGDDGSSGWFQAEQLLRRLLDAQLSRFEPDPVRALAEVEANPQPA